MRQSLALIARWVSHADPVTIRSESDKASTPRLTTCAGQFSAGILKKTENVFQAPAVPLRRSLIATAGEGR